MSTKKPADLSIQNVPTAQTKGEIVSITNNSAKSVLRGEILPPQAPQGTPSDGDGEFDRLSEVGRVVHTQDGGKRLLLSSKGERMIMWAIFMMFPLTAFSLMMGRLGPFGAVAWVPCVWAITVLYLYYRRRKTRARDGDPR